MALVCAMIGVPISYISSHLRLYKTVESNSIVSTVIIILIQLVKYCSIVSPCDNFINYTCEFELAYIEFSISIEWIKANYIKYRNLFRQLN